MQHSVRTLAQTSIILLLALPASADDRYSGVAVQNRQNLIDHEFGLAVGILPMDAFTKGLTVSGSYTLHFSEAWAWEIAQFFWSFHLETDLRDELRAAGNLKPTPFEVLNFFVTTNAVFKPVYWKGSALNRSLVYGEMLVLLGAGYAQWTRSDRPVVDAGVALRFFAGEWFSFRLDTRYLLFVSTDGGSVDHDVWIGLGTAVGF